ncbi:MAG: DUF1178 family protein, partial [Acetobacteraceae bacterium]
MADAGTKLMIHYQIRCSRGHEFDGWFKDSRGFDCQVESGFVECPVCRGTDVARALMAPALPRAAAAPTNEKEAQAAEPTPKPAPEPLTHAPMAVTGSGMPDQMRAVFQRIRSEVEKNCDYVGPSFTEEARRMHRGESKRRGIYGEATPEQAESLSDEGISVARIPW